MVLFQKNYWFFSPWNKTCEMKPHEIKLTCFIFLQLPLLMEFHFDRSWVHSPQWGKTLSEQLPPFNETIQSWRMIETVLRVQKGQLNACMTGFFWIQMKGYMAIGISDDSFRNALHYALDQNHIQFEEQVSLIKLTNSNADLLVSVQSWVGTGQLKLKQSKSKHLLNTLVPSINQYFQSLSVIMV